MNDAASPRHSHRSRPFQSRQLKDFNAALNAVARAAWCTAIAAGIASDNTASAITAEARRKLP